MPFCSYTIKNQNKWASVEFQVYNFINKIRELALHLHSQLPWKRLWGLRAKCMRIKKEKSPIAGPIL